ncbi:MAG: hypothetical protein PHP20_10835 [Firmicutes bacterium]|nr:hypothetical protein [Bacillota bacterium]MDD4336420.1 hypothetical protein [Bacillota bacterium]MDD4793544.1 hypothetical protein [Bacillota bacterium]
MALENCSRCGRLYQRVAKPLCPDCMVEEEEYAERVVEYLRRHSGATIREIAEAVEVDEGFVLRLLRGGRIEMANDVRPELHCRACGLAIKAGTYCSECLARFGKAFSGKEALGTERGLGRGDDDREVRYRDRAESREKASGVRMSTPDRRRKRSK